MKNLPVVHRTKAFNVKQDRDIFQFDIMNKKYINAIHFKVTEEEMSFQQVYCVLIVVTKESSLSIKYL